MSHSIEIAAAGQLLRSVVDIADGCATLANRRQALLESLASLAQAGSGLWAWGRGRPESDHILAVATIPFGFTEAELKAVFEFSLDARVQEEFHRLLQAHLRKHLRDDGVWSVIHTEAFPADQYPPDHWIVQSMRRAGGFHWMQCGRFLPNDTFSLVDLCRRQGQPEFVAADKLLVELAISSIPWLWAHPEETVPQEAVEALSPRQRAVMYFVLDGLSRKKIAAKLNISEETVNHHMKAIYQHFQVQSATELAALFLRSQ